MAITDAECSLSLITIADPDPIIRIQKIQFNKNRNFQKTIQDLANQRKENAILAYNPIQRSVVDAKAQLLSFLGHKEDQRARRADRRPDPFFPLSLL